MQSQENIAILIALGCLAMLVLVIVIIMFVAIYQRKMSLKEAKIQLMEKEKQISLFRASVEAEERQKEKIAHNLHDEINPLLTVLKFNLSKHRIEIRKNKFEPDSLITDAELLDKAIDGIRTTCLDLVPVFLLEYGLIKSLENYIRNVKQIGDISTEFESNLQPNDLIQFEKQDQLNAYRMCLEIVNNLFKHAQCTFLKLSLSLVNTNLQIEFIHNGKGITNEQVEHYTETSNGLGLKSLKARALILNAHIDYISGINTSLVKLNIPFHHG